MFSDGGKILRVCMRRSQISLLVYIVATPFAASSKCCYTASLFQYLDLHVA
jgi:hypothetical protein